MYLIIIILPLLGSIVSGFLGRNLGVKGSQIITSSSVIITTMLALLTFIEVGYNNIPVTINLIKWIDSESLYINWGFYFDSLTVSMLIPVLIVSSLVHIYSIGYMSHDPRDYIKEKCNCGDKLSNSGELLKLKVPSCSWKTICGWSNYSGKVTSLKIGENQMDNRGSKSAICESIAVKEQRVDGSLSIKRNLMDLRCTLRVFERNIDKNLGFNILSLNPCVKIPSEQYGLREFSTYNTTLRSIHPGVWSGFIDGEGSFSIIVSKDETRKLGWRVEL